MTNLYGGQRGWRRPDRCGCGKIPYADEAAALAAAGLRSEETGVPLTVYKCPGSSRWHKTSSGFHPRSLKSRPRMVAWHLSARRVITVDDLFHELGLKPGLGEDRNAKSAVIKVLRVFAELGLARRDSPRPPYVAAADDAGLLRVMQVGLEEYAASRGTTLTGPSQQTTSASAHPIVADNNQ